MTKFTITARNAAQLSAQIDRFNATIAKDHPLDINFGPEGRGGWFVSYAGGSYPRTGLSFTSVVAQVRQDVEQRQQDIESGAFDDAGAFA